MSDDVMSTSPRCVDSNDFNQFLFFPKTEVSGLSRKCKRKKGKQKFPADVFTAVCFCAAVLLFLSHVLQHQGIK